MPGRFTNEDPERLYNSGERDYWRGGSRPATLGEKAYYVVHPAFGLGEPFVDYCYATSYLCRMEGPFPTFHEAWNHLEKEHRP